MTTRFKHLYLHVPFCASICHYCDFCHRIYDERLAERWLKRLEQEIRDKCDGQYETIYIGGGTPTSLSCVQLEELLRILKPYAEGCIEYTIEVNPESLDEEKVFLFGEYGINRISMGVQTTDDVLLKSLNRKHTFSDVKDKISLLRSHGLCNISADLMYSLPGQDMDILKKTLSDILELDLPHLSLYSLTIEENSVFGKKGIDHLDDDMEADMYELIAKTLEENGYLRYEVSNFCRKGFESKHNMGYWNYDDFIGVSLGASGKIGNRRYTNTRSFDRYFNDDDITDEDLLLSNDEMEFENIMMSLRTTQGLDIREFNERYGCDLLEKYRKGVSDPNIGIKDGRLVCTDIAVLNRVLLGFMDG